MEILEPYRLNRTCYAISRENEYDGKELFNYFLYSLGANECLTLQEALEYGILGLIPHFLSEEIPLETKAVLFDLVEHFLNQQNMYTQIFNYTIYQK